MFGDGSEDSYSSSGMAPEYLVGSLCVKPILKEPQTSTFRLLGQRQGPPAHVHAELAGHAAVPAGEALVWDRADH